MPLRDYEDLLYFLKDEYKELCKMLEPNISVKVKEELSVSLMSIFHYEEMAEDVLADIVVDEISSVENEHLTFRGNSIATKAMESYIKLVGQKYLQVVTVKYNYSNHPNTWCLLLSSQDSSVGSTLRLVLGRSGVQISPSSIEFSIGERLRERF